MVTHLIKLLKGHESLLFHFEIRIRTLTMRFVLLGIVFPFCDTVTLEVIWNIFVLLGAPHVLSCFAPFADSSEFQMPRWLFFAEIVSPSRLRTVFVSLCRRIAPGTVPCTKPISNNLLNQNKILICFFGNLLNLKCQY